MKRPLVLINLKKTTGAGALSLVNCLNKTSPVVRDRFEIVLAILPGDVGTISGITDLPLFLHDISLECPLYELPDLDEQNKGKLSGMLINHPENKLAESILTRNFHCAKALGLRTIIGATSVKEAQTLHAAYRPDYIAIEDESLIGKDLSISEKCPAMVEQAVAAIPNSILFGAGVRCAGDIEYIIGKGGSGVMVSSVIIKAMDPAEALRELLDLVVESTFIL